MPPPTNRAGTVRDWRRRANETNCRPGGPLDRSKGLKQGRGTWGEGTGEELRIHDAAIEHLRAVPSLRFLSVLNLPISPAALDELKQARQAITIDR